MQEGFILEARPYSNTSVIVKIFTKENGKISGFIKGGNSKQSKINTILYGLTLTSFGIKKRLEEHLGLITITEATPFMLLNIKNKIKTLVLNSVLELIYFLTGEGDADETLYNNLKTFIEYTTQEEDKINIIEQYILFEFKALSLFGFGIDLEECAISGKKEDLFFISPVTGRCAGFAAAKDFANKLLTIPKIYGNKQLEINKEEDLKNAFNINSHFLKQVPNFEKLTFRTGIINYI